MHLPSTCEPTVAAVIERYNGFGLYHHAYSVAVLVSSLQLFIMHNSSSLVWWVSFHCLHVKHDLRYS